MAELEIQCPHCELLFDVPPSMKGGIASCPDCGRTVKIAGGPEPLYWLLVGLAVFVLLAVSGGIALANPVVGAIVLLCGGVVISLVAMAS